MNIVTCIRCYVFLPGSDITSKHFTQHAQPVRIFINYNLQTMNTETLVWVKNPEVSEKEHGDLWISTTVINKVHFIP